jgi:dolichol kinase
MLARKIWHASGVIFVLIYEGLDLSRPLAAGLLLGATALLLLLDVLRHRFERIQGLFREKLHLILDEKDLPGLNGATLYWGGCGLAIALFPKEPACGGILALALGDSMAAIIGSRVRSPRWGRVSVAGSGACLVAATLAARWYFPWPVAVAGGVTAAALEAFSGTKLDNTTIPLGTSLVLYAMG